MASAATVLLARLGDDSGLSERVDLGVRHQLVLDGIAPDRPQMIRVRVPAPLRQALFQYLAPPSQDSPVVHVLYGCRRTKVLEQRLGRGAVDLRAGFPEIVREDVLLGELLRRHSTPPSASVMTVRLVVQRLLREQQFGVLEQVSLELFRLARARNLDGPDVQVLTGLPV